MSLTPNILQELREPQHWPGWRVAPTHDGWMLYPPDKTLSGVLTHKTPSDWRAWKNTMALLKRRGAPV